MSLQNRVHVSGIIVSDDSRGLLMGNRGCLHNLQKQVVKNYQLKRWIYCTLQYYGNRRPVMSPNRYTELFFMDEFTALAAGHRPCAQCQAKKYQSFKTFWQVANEMGSVSTQAMDNFIHTERTQNKETLYTLVDLPNGVMVKQKENYYLLYNNQLYLWSFKGYSQSSAYNTTDLFALITPVSVMKTIKAGFSVDVIPADLAF